MSSSANEIEFTSNEKTALMGMLFSTSSSGEYLIDRMIRWEIEVKFGVMADDDGVGTTYTKMLVEEIGHLDGPNIFYRENKANVIFVFSSDIIVSAQQHRELFSKFIVGSNDHDRLEKADNFIRSQTNNGSFGQVSVKSIENGILAAMFFVKSGDEQQVAHAVACNGLKILGLYGEFSTHVDSVLNLDLHPAWLTDFDHRALEFVYSKSVQSGASIGHVMNALLITN